MQDKDLEARLVDLLPGGKLKALYFDYVKQWSLCSVVVWFLIVNNLAGASMNGLKGGL